MRNFTSRSILRGGASLLASLVCLSGFAATEMGELPLGETITVTKDQVYTFTPKSDGILSIEFDGSYPENGILWSNLYNPSFNDEMIMIQASPLNGGGAFGPTSPAQYEIRMIQPAPDSDARVLYQVVAPDEIDILNPANSRTSITIKATFEEAGEGTVANLSNLSQTPGGVFNFNQSGTLIFYFDPMVYGLSCSSILFDMYVGEDLVKSVPGDEREMTWEYSGYLGGYFINLTNLWDYELKDTQIDSFTVTLSGFNRNIAGEWVDEQGKVVLHYLVDEFYGMLKLEETTGWPQYLYPKGAEPSTVTLTYSGALDPSAGGEVKVLGADIPEINSEPSAKTNVYAPAFKISGSTVTIDFNDFKQTGPVDDGGNLVAVDGYRTPDGVMSVIVSNFLGADGSQVQPVLVKINWQAQSGVEITAAPLSSASDVYNLQGIRVLSGTSDLRSLPAGIYIIDGKKIKL